MLFVVTIAVLVSMALLIIRAVIGPTTYDRILSANAFGTKTVVLIALIGHAMGTTMFLDIALIYALVNFITTIAFLKYFKYRTFGEK